MTHNIAIEYGLETLDGELINYFTWRELMKYFMGVPTSTLKMACYRGTVLLGQYRLYQVKYTKED